MKSRGVKRYFLGLLVAVALFGQASSARLEFEVASIKPAAPDEFNRAGAGMHVDGSQVSWKFLSLHNYISAAFGLKGYEIAGPDWLASQRFDIVAKLPAGGTPKDVPEMLRAVLEDRFRLKTHRENRDLAVYGLVVGKGGLKVQESPPDPPKEVQPPGASVDVAAQRSPGGVTVNLGNGAYYTFADNKLEGRKMPIFRMANLLAAFLDRPVIDQTSAKGNFDFVLELSPEDFRAMGIRAAVGAGATLPPQAIQMAEAASGDSLRTALEKLGLKLESRKAPVAMLVIDHAEKVPSDN